MFVRLLCATLLLFAPVISNAADVVKTLRLKPGSPAETSLLLTGSLTSVEGELRRAEAGGFWTYRVVLTPGARCVFRFEADGDPGVTVVASDGKPLPSRMDQSGTKRSVYTTAPANHPLAGGLRFQFTAKTGPVGIRDLVIEIRQPDSNGDGIPDAIATMMGAAPGQHIDVTPRPARPQSSFQTGGSYDPGIAVPTDAVLAYTSDPLAIQSWMDKGYTVQTMGGFRADEAYVKQHPDEVQRDSNGNPVSIGGNSYYMVPTAQRINIAKQFFGGALAAGSTAVCPEEPEYSTQSGYEEPFKAEWKALFGTLWEPPHSSIQARYKSEQLKGILEKKQIEAILNDAQTQKPAATRMVAIHSPVTYYQWGYPVPHYGLLMLPALQEIIGQVWTGTARTHARAAGVRSERTFEVGFLEYSSLYNLARGSGKRMWFLMDPLEDNPDRTNEDYRSNYEQTLVASLMFPPIDSFEVMPWPKRIYDKVPPGYATAINSVAGVLSELWRYPNGQIDAGSDGIGVFVSDSMAWQREEPAPSDYDGFYGLCLPLVMHGVPVQVLSLDRIREGAYLNRLKTLLVSYDYLKPENPEINRALADWTNRGGSLVIFGGTDPYNSITDSWWRKANLASPLDDLFRQLGVGTRRAAPSSPDTMRPASEVVLKGDGNEHDLRNRRTYTVDLTAYARENGSAEVRFEDITPADGWGAWVASAELRIGGKLAASFSAGSDLETRFLTEESGSKFNGTARFVDRNGYWVYRFDNLPKNVSVVLNLDMANGFLVKAGTGGDRPALLETTEKSFGPSLMRLRLPQVYSPTLYVPPVGATTLYKLSSEPNPVVWETTAGSGHVTYAGLPPGYLTATAQTSRWIRALTRRAFEQAGGKYEEQGAFISKRGPYTAVHTLGKEYSLDGNWVNLLSPTLAVAEDPVVPPRSNALYQAMGPDKGDPRLLAASGRVRAKAERADSTGFMVQAPSRTEGVARLWTDGRKAVGARGYTMMGEPVTVSLYPDGETLLVRYQNDADGVVVKIAWQ